jgi:hypothetical protein
MFRRTFSADGLAGTQACPYYGANIDALPVKNHLKNTISKMKFGVRCAAVETY